MKRSCKASSVWLVTGTVFLVPLLAAGGCPPSSGLSEMKPEASYEGTLELLPGYAGWSTQPSPVSNLSGAFRISVSSDGLNRRLDAYAGIIPGLTDAGTTQARVDLVNGTISGTVTSPQGVVRDLGEIVPGLTPSPPHSNDFFLTQSGNGQVYIFIMDVPRLNDPKSYEGTVGYSWNIPNDAEASLHLPHASGSFAVKPIDESAMAAPLGSVPAPIHVDAGPDQSIQPGKSVTLSATVVGGQGGLRHTWSPTEGLDNPTDIQPHASPRATTTYTLTAADQKGAQASDTVVVTMGGVPDEQGVVVEQADVVSATANMDPSSRDLIGKTAFDSNDLDIVYRIIGRASEDVTRADAQFVWTFPDGSTRTTMPARYQSSAYCVYDGLSRAVGGLAFANGTYAVAFLFRGEELDRRTFTYEQSPEVPVPEEILSDPIVAQALTELNAQGIELNPSTATSPPALAGRYRREDRAGVFTATHDGTDVGRRVVGDEWTWVATAPLELASSGFTFTDGMTIGQTSSVINIVRGSGNTFTVYATGWRACTEQGSNFRVYCSEINVGTVDPTTGDLVNCRHFLVTTRTEGVLTYACADRFVADSEHAGGWSVYRVDRVRRID